MSPHDLPRHEIDDGLPPVDDLLEAKRKERRARIRVWLSVLVVLLVLLVLAWFQYDNYRKDEIERLASEQVDAQLTELCETGKIDCEGTRGLPGPKGNPGIGILKQRCNPDTERWEFTYTSGRVRSMGDCIATDGARGPRGHVGPRGPSGPPGQRGLRGPRGKRGAHGKSFLGGKPRLLAYGDMLTPTTTTFWVRG